MRVIGKLSFPFAMFAFFFAHSQCMAASKNSNPCELPPGLQEMILKKFPDRKVEAAADLKIYDRKLYRKDHGAACPGLAKINFYGDQKPTWALVLIGGKDPKKNAELVIAHRLDIGWETQSLETTDGFPVVWRESAGKYEDVYGQESIKAPYPVVVFCGYESWAILYAWTGSEVKKIWISD